MKKSIKMLSAAFAAVMTIGLYSAESLACPSCEGAGNPPVAVEVEGVEVVYIAPNPVSFQGFPITADGMTHNMNLTNVNGYNFPNAQVVAFNEAVDPGPILAVNTSTYGPAQSHTIYNFPNGDVMEVVNYSTPDNTGDGVPEQTVLIQTRTFYTGNWSTLVLQNSIAIHTSNTPYR